jgi:hypothetical protein
LSGAWQFARLELLKVCRPTAGETFDGNENLRFALPDLVQIIGKPRGHARLAKDPGWSTL